MRRPYKTIFSYTLREYDDQPSWNIHIKDNTNHPISIHNVGKISLRQHNDYDFKELEILYFKRRGGIYGELYEYYGTKEKYTIQLEDIIIERNDTKKKYTIKEYEAYIQTHPLKEGGIIDAPVVTIDQIRKYKEDKKCFQH